MRTSRLPYPRRARRCGRQRRCFQHGPRRRAGGDVADDHRRGPHDGRRTARPPPPPHRRRRRTHDGRRARHDHGRSQRRPLPELPPRWPVPATMLPPNATLEQIQAAVIGAFGPTTDITGELAPFCRRRARRASPRRRARSSRSSTSTTTPTPRTRASLLLVDDGVHVGGAGARARHLLPGGNARRRLRADRRLGAERRRAPGPLPHVRRAGADVGPGRGDRHRRRRDGRHRRRLRPAGDRLRPRSGASSRSRRLANRACRSSRVSRSRTPA